jgi:glycine/D-amino acid oxidase-like deaminating enzyme
MRIGIVGNGIIGTSLAYKLIKFAENSKDKIFLFGDQNRVNSASTAAAAMLNSFAEVEHFKFDQSIDNYKFDLSRKATLLWPKFIKEITSDSQLNELSESYKLGTFVINNSAADNLDDLNFEAIISKMIDLQEPYSMVNPTDIPNYKPIQKFRAQRALFIPNEGWLNPNLLLLALDRIIAKSESINFVNSRVVNIANASGVFQLKSREDTIYEVDVLIIANGAEMNQFQLEDKLGLKIQRLFYGIGTTIELQSEFSHTNCVRTPNRGLACGIYSAPYLNHYDSKQNIIIGASNFISNSPETHVRLASIKNLVTAAEEQINKDFYRSNLVSVNVGWRPISQDTYPLIGKTSVNNLYVINGTKRDGFHFSPLISEEISKQIYHNSNDIFERFNPERDIFRFGTREDVIEISVRHKLSGIYQHGFNPSDSRFEDSVVKSIRSEIEIIYDNAGISDFALPVEMLDMYKYKHAII